MKTCLLLTCALLGLAGSEALAQGIPTVAKADFRNELKNSAIPGDNPPANQSSSVAIFGGHLGGYLAPGAVAPPDFLGTALTLDGVNDVVRIRYFGAAVPTNEVTVEFWIKAEEQKAQLAFSLEPSDFPNNSFAAGVCYNDGKTYWDFGKSYPNGRLVYAPPDSMAGTWQHVALVSSRSSSGMWILRNGVEVTNKAGSSSFTRGTYDLLIGYLMRGQIAEFRIWNRARATAEIRADMNRRLAGDEPNLVAYWPFDEVSGTVVHDETGHGYDGVLENGPQWGPPAPSDGTVRLVESSFAQALAAQVPYPDFVTASQLAAQSLLYPNPTNATRAQLEAPTGWAFRYKTLLYSNDNAGIVALNNMRTELFGEDEREDVRKALVLLRGALAWAPYDLGLRHTYLDVFYDELVAESQFILKGEMARLATYRLGLQRPPPDKFIIDLEIGIYTNVMSRFTNVLARYGALFTDHGGVDLASFDPTVPPDMRFGYYVFREMQPIRNQMAAQFLDTDGVFKTVPDLDDNGQVLPVSTNERPLYAGYKDFVGLMKILAEYTQSGAELTRLYGIRGIRSPTQDDAAAGLALINHLQQEVSTQARMLADMFPSDAFPPGDTSGARAQIDGVTLGLADLNGVRGFLEGRANLLGFDPNFLVLIQEAPGLNPTSQNQPFDSYDSLVRWLRYTDTSPLPYAQNTFDEAVTSYMNFRAYADRVADDLAEVEDASSDRHWEITGYDAGDPEWTGRNPRPGSELAEVKTNQFKLGQRSNYLDSVTTNLKNQVAHAKEFVDAAGNKANEIDKTFSNYKTSTASSWDSMQTWESTAAAAQAATEATYAAASCIASVSAWDPAKAAGGVAGAAVSAAAGVANSILQGESASAITRRKQELDYANAGYWANLGKVDANIQSLQAQQDFDALLREQITHQSDLADLNAMIGQELAHEAALRRELERLRLNVESQRSTVAARYYADPLHAERAEAYLLRADSAFRRAQRWVFFVQRALEYKWNKNFAYAFPGGRSYDRGTIFKLRNAEELEELVAAIEDFNTANLLGFNREAFVDRISLRDEVLLPWAGTGPDTGLRADPLNPGQMLPKVDLFRLVLKGQRPGRGVVEYDSAGNLRIKLDPFVIAQNRRSCCFFMGPVYDTNGCIVMAGKHLDKVQWLKFNFVSSTQTETLAADLRYSGQCAIYNAVPQCWVLPFQIPDAFRRFPFQYFYTLDNGQTFRMDTYQRDTVKLAFAPVSGEPERNVPNSIFENRFLKERTVAVTELRLTLPRHPQTQQLLVDLDHLDDVELYVSHFSVTILQVPNCSGCN